MSEIGDDFQAMRDVSQEKRRRNTEWSTLKLIREGVAFTSHNNGAHLVVEERWDFWPSTGLYIDRVTGDRARGVHKLLKKVRSNSDARAN